MYVKFTTVDIDCNTDSVKVYDQHTVNASTHISWHLCDGRGTTNIISTGNILFITFITGNRSNHSGFVLTWGQIEGRDMQTYKWPTN